MGENFDVLGKIQTRTNFFRSNRKKLKIDKDGNESVVTISCKIGVHPYRYMDGKILM